jgi:hypothetical protein
VKIRPQSVAFVNVGDNKVPAAHGHKLDFRVRRNAAFRQKSENRFQTQPEYEHGAGIDCDNPQG